MFPREGIIWLISAYRDHDFPDKTPLECKRGGMSIKRKRTGKKKESTEMEHKRMEYEEAAHNDQFMNLAYLIEGHGVKDRTLPRTFQRCPAAR